MNVELFLSIASNIIMQMLRALITSQTLIIHSTGNYTRSLQFDSGFFTSKIFGNRVNVLSTTYYMLFDLVPKLYKQETMLLKHAAGLSVYIS